MLIGAESDRLANAITIGSRIPAAMYRTSTINASPWDEVAVITRAPAAAAPTHADNAECSLSTGTSSEWTIPSCTYWA